MSRVWQIAGAEWQLWRRSRLALVSLLVFAVLLAVTSMLSAARMTGEAKQRQAQQTLAEERYRAQPPRHPHRMVHYGHYVFRTPPPLALFDPGVDAVTGQSLFLEGHRQNSDMFADARAAPNTGGFGRLDPALVYQLFLPLLLIAMGHACILREREAGTLATVLAQGVPASSVYLGKLLALATVAVLMLLPAAALGVVGLVHGESLAPVTAVLGVYAGYLLLWVAIILLVSMRARQRGVALGVLLLVWLGWALLLPRFAVSYASAGMPLAGKLHSDLLMQAAQRNLADGHNANDPAFAALRDGLLAEYGVERVEDLPVNFRGVVASHAEAKLTTVLNAYAEERMQQEQQQLTRLAQIGWLSPTLATGLASRALAGTGLATHHRFLREAEALRFEFVQGLNALHAHQLSYADDVRRSSDVEAERRTRVDAQNWQQLPTFDFQIEAAGARLAAALPHTLPLLAWLLLALLVGIGFARRLQP